jgi:hypothetical protein
MHPGLGKCSSYRVSLANRSEKIDSELMSYNRMRVFMPPRHMLCAAA